MKHFVTLCNLLASFLISLHILTKIAAAAAAEDSFVSDNELSDVKNMNEKAIVNVGEKEEIFEVDQKLLKPSGNMQEVDVMVQTSVEEKNNRLRMEIRRVYEPCFQPGIEQQKSTEGLDVCRNKIRISIRLINEGKTLTNERIIVLQSVYDVVAKEYIQLFNPIVIKLKQDQVANAYQFHHMYSVNNKAYEDIIYKNTELNFTGCRDEETVAKLCGNIVGIHGQILNWHMPQGFCCSCALQPTSSHPEYRGGQLACPLNYSQFSEEEKGIYASAHCLKFDYIWYSVNRLLHPQIYHSLELKVFIEDDSETQSSWLDLTNSQTINVGTMRKTDSGPFGMVAAEYSRVKSETEELPFDASKKFLLLPLPVAIEKEDIHSQLKEGAESYLLVDQNMVMPDGMVCDKVGVGYTAFVSQQDRCKKPTQSCLKMQPMDLWIEDEERIKKGQKGKYYLNSFGPLSERPFLQEKNQGDNYLLYEYHAEYQSEVVIELNADHFQFLRRGAHGVIQQLSITDERALVELVVRIVNSAAVTNTYFVQLTKCSEPFVEGETRYLVIPPQYSAKAIFRKDQKSGRELLTNTSFYCTVQLLNHRHEKIAVRTITFHALDRCFCVAYCRCRCVTDGDLSCRYLSSIDYQLAGFHGLTPKMKLDLKYKWPNIIGTAIICLLLIGALKAFISPFLPPIWASLGLCLFRKRRLKTYLERELRGIDVRYNHLDVPIHPATHLPVRCISPLLEFVLNFFFGVYVWLIPLHWLVLRMYYFVKAQHARKDTKSVDDDKVPLLQSNACANRIYPASSLDKDFADKFHQDLTQNPGDCRTRLEDDFLPPYLASS